LPASRLNTFDFAKAELVYFVRSHMRGGAAIDVILVALLAVWQRRDGKRGASLWSVFLADECREALVGRKTSVLTASVICCVRRFWSSAEMLAGYFFVGRRKGSAYDNALALDWHLLKKKRTA